MKLKINSSEGAQGGFALVAALLIAAACLVILVATVGRSSTTTLLNNRNNEYTAGLYAAEAATEKVVARMQFDFLNGSLTYINDNLPSYRT
ncbi:MAG: hypothetical protein ACREIC_18890, partial [Limisphaerales bacterium]